MFVITCATLYMSLAIRAASGNLILILPSHGMLWTGGSRPSLARNFGSVPTTIAHILSRRIVPRNGRVWSASFLATDKWTVPLARLRAIGLPTVRVWLGGGLGATVCGIAAGQCRMRACRAGDGRGEPHVAPGCGAWTRAYRRLVVPGTAQLDARRQWLGKPDTSASVSGTITFAVSWPTPRIVLTAADHLVLALLGTAGVPLGPLRRSDERPRSRGQGPGARARGTAADQRDGLRTCGACGLYGPPDAVSLAPPPGCWWGHVHSRRPGSYASWFLDRLQRGLVGGAGWPDYVSVR